ncbi:ribosomal L7Ae/L30e/S12e/Gadd45 family protein [Geomicrobium sp. JCM 19039]|uniref:ribosomal L7Ae/L30e/S12e/Gadd45 family protein n=1 Tax=Geomicrobium sp. JCM 19039 TaxID=1460636 RepID=UPI00045F269C|nr:ribosomal L7Ae/L30e/S12e/Gadd45 family protein [Geomicrobium sp. JCM 19039]GAK13841.1 ribosomal L7Ae family protein [Geomicrobium sp. JCM 19039]
MGYDKVMNAGTRYVGLKRTIKAISDGLATEVFVAEDADHELLRKVSDTAYEKQIPLVMVPSMKKLGKACGIEVNAAAVAIKK